MITFMRRKTCILLCIFICLLSLSTAASAQVRINAAAKQGSSIYSAPSLSSEILIKLDNSEQVVVQDWKDGGFCSVCFGEVKGYIPSDKLVRVVVTETYDRALSGKVSADSVNLRTKPDTDSNIITVMDKGTSVEVVGRENNWYKVVVRQTVGYISVEYVELLSNDKDDADKDRFIELRMGMSGKEVARMQNALSQLGYYNHECNGNFGSRTRDALKRFQSENDLTSDGIASGATLKLLFEKAEALQ